MSNCFQNLISNIFSIIKVVSKNNDIKDFTNKIIENPGGIYRELTKQMLSSHE
jgi:hypothetical protein